MKPLNYQLKQLCEANRDGAYATQANRERMLSQMANQLYDLGYRHMSVHSLKHKHRDALLKLWREQGIAVSTQKNRLATVNWWARKINKPKLVVNDYSTLGVPNREYVPRDSKALDKEDSQFVSKLALVKDNHVRLSIRLQAEFGLRREEAIKFSPGHAMQGDHIELRASWTKGGRARAIPILTDAQRVLLEDIRQLTGNGSLIPPHQNYAQQLRRYERQIRNVKLGRLHGLRHGYVQRRYLELTGWPCPLAGGPRRRDLSLEQKPIDKEARIQIALEVGHGRESISTAYIGR